MKQVKDSFNTDYEIIGYDGGNVGGKTVLIVDPRGNELEVEEKRYFKTSFENNSVIPLSQDDYEEALRRGIGDSNNGIIRVVDTFYDKSNTRIKEDLYFAVGDVAQYFNQTQQERRTKAQKYYRYYYGIQAMLGVRNIFGDNIPKKFHIVGGHPPLNDTFRDAIRESLHGNWEIYFSEKKFKFEVVSTKVLDEIVGSAMNHTLQIDGRKNGNSITTKGGQTLIFDLGGGTADVALLNDKGFPIPGTHQSAEIGILGAIDEFKRLFDKEYAALMVDSATGIPLSRVYEIFLDKDHKLRNVGGVKDGEIDCKWLFDAVINKSLISKLSAIVNNMVGNLSMAASRVIITGGAGDLLYSKLADTVFKMYADNGQLYPAAAKGYGIYANAYGMAKFGHGLRLAEQRRKR